MAGPRMDPSLPAFANVAGMPDGEARCSVRLYGVEALSGLAKL